MQNSEKNSRLDRTPINKYDLCDIKSKDFDLFHPTFFDPYFLKYIGSTVMLSRYMI